MGQFGRELGWFDERGLPTGETKVIPEMVQVGVRQGSDFRQGTEFSEPIELTDDTEVALRSRPPLRGPQLSYQSKPYSELATTDKFVPSNLAKEPVIIKGQGTFGWDGGKVYAIDAEAAKNHDVKAPKIYAAEVKPQLEPSQRRLVPGVFFADGELEISASLPNLPQEESLAAKPKSVESPLFRRRGGRGGSISLVNLKAAGKASAAGYAVTPNKEIGSQPSLTQPSLTQHQQPAQALAVAQSQSWQAPQAQPQQVPGSWANASATPAGPDWSQFSDFSGNQVQQNQNYILEAAIAQQKAENARRGLVEHVPSDLLARGESAAEASVPHNFAESLALQVGVPTGVTGATGGACFANTGRAQTYSSVGSQFTDSNLASLNLTGSALKSPESRSLDSISLQSASALVGAHSHQLEEVAQHAEHACHPEQESDFEVSKLEQVLKSNTAESELEAAKLLRQVRPAAISTKEVSSDNRARLSGQRVQAAYQQTTKLKLPKNNNGERVIDTPLRQLEQVGKRLAESSVDFLRPTPAAKPQVRRSRNNTTAPSLLDQALKESGLELNLEQIKKYEPEKYRQLQAQEQVRQAQEQAKQNLKNLDQVEAELAVFGGMAAHAVSPQELQAEQAAIAARAEANQAEGQRRRAQPSITTAKFLSGNLDLEDQLPSYLKDKASLATQATQSAVSVGAAGTGADTAGVGAGAAEAATAGGSSPDKSASGENAPDSPTSDSWISDGWSSDSWTSGAWSGDNSSASWSADNPAIGSSADNPEDLSWSAGVGNAAISWSSGDQQANPSVQDWQEPSALSGLSSLGLHRSKSLSPALLEKLAPARVEKAFAPLLLAEEEAAFRAKFGNEKFVSKPKFSLSQPYQPTLQALKQTISAAMAQAKVTYVDRTDLNLIGSLEGPSNKAVETYYGKDGLAAFNFRTNQQNLLDELDNLIRLYDQGEPSFLNGLRGIVCRAIQQVVSFDLTLEHVEGFIDVAVNGSGLGSNPGLPSLQAQPTEPLGPQLKMGLAWLFNEDPLAIAKRPQLYLNAAEFVRLTLEQLQNLELYAEMVSLELDSEQLIVLHESEFAIDTENKVLSYVQVSGDYFDDAAEVIRDEIREKYAAAGYKVKEVQAVDNTLLDLVAAFVRQQLLPLQ